MRSYVIADLRKLKSAKKLGSLQETLQNLNYLSPQMCGFLIYAELICGQPSFAVKVRIQSKEYEQTAVIFLRLSLLFLPAMREFS